MFDSSRSPIRAWRAVRARRALVLLLAPLLLGLASHCGSSAGPVSAAAFGPPARTENGRIAIDKTSLVGSIDGGTLSLGFAVRAVGPQAASGVLHARLLDVKGSTTVGETVASYRVDPGGTASVQATLPAPPGLTDQADLALWNVRIDDGATASLRVTRSMLLTVPPYEVRLEGPAAVNRGKALSYRVRAQDPIRHTPVANAKVSLDVLSKAGATLQSFDGTTS